MFFQSICVSNDVDDLGIGQNFDLLLFDFFFLGPKLLFDFMFCNECFVRGHCLEPYEETMDPCCLIFVVVVVVV